ncbi:biotin--[acetyl-CoA-carboxylase] ligase [Lutimonas zeaxanthinifaciens]|uniref:biotin--[acetyl-CoA-carboxylase] ligase n=1 Tax=Lutimonas zeaxanthinifaciens TaxID=3060215 RepID=UPI00265CA520|nr:biotin--[acetyl-CoA-carboxylase] ligase [Lutimonas sp. YSD2104]WKK64964.1 biotin--[acetyl-CoA-carboxylase] ligase [Lutimonas sp. YSD2104]
MYLFKLDATDSTNSYLKQLSKNENLGKWTVVTAKFQTSGRGQKGAVWESERGKNLICSILLKLEGVKAEDQFMLNCAVSTGIHHYLKRFNLPKLTVKWPNDIMSVSRKLGGILIENTLFKGEISQSIIGVGINVNQESFSDDLPAAVSLKQLTGSEMDLEIFLQDLLNSIQNKFALVFENRYGELKSQYEANLYRKDKVHTFKNFKGEQFSGIIRGVNYQGTLQIERENGSMDSYNFKEVSYL